MKQIKGKRKIKEKDLNLSSLQIFSFCFDEIKKQFKIYFSHKRIIQAAINQKLSVKVNKTVPGDNVIKVFMTN